VKKLPWILSLALFCLVSGAQDNAPMQTPSAGNSTNSNPTPGRKLFLKNCAHCHGADAHGDDGPDLHGLDDSDKWIANRIRNGKKGQMTAFAGKLPPSEIESLVAYLRTLK
jgi:mono/diheme cytochrome c family protein